MTQHKRSQIKTLGQLKETDYRPISVKAELRKNLISAIKKNQDIFNGIVGYEDTVIPELKRAILSRHNIILLGLRGQAKTRIARLMVDLLDEYIPVVSGSEINDDPFKPISRYARDLVADQGDETPIEWIHRSQRYTEKLATPDVTVADLIGDLDPIKAASQKLEYSDERVIHFGLVPRSHRSIFTINELPDLQARIQVALFNILQESDIQIRGFKLRLPLDIAFVFTANPEDYTNRGSIVTPLKDRIDSQIMTHYPKTVAYSKKITQQEADVDEGQQQVVRVPELVEDLLEQIAFEARNSEYIDEKSGVSARLTISGYENLVSTAEYRALVNNETKTQVRIADIFGVIPSITGKVELVYEGEQEGPIKIAHILINKAVRAQFIRYFPDPEKIKKEQEMNPYQRLIDWFNNGNSVELRHQASRKDYEKQLKSIEGLEALIKQHHPKASVDERFLLMEFALYGLVEFSFLSKYPIESGFKIRDMMSTMFDADDDNDEDDFRDNLRNII